MDRFILSDDEVPMRIEMAELRDALHVRQDHSDARILEEMAREACRMGKPKVLYRPAAIEGKDQEGILIDGVRLTGTVLAGNLRDVDQVVLFVATCGQELHDWSARFTDLLESFWADEIKNRALISAIASFHETLEAQGLGHLATMNPGSLEAWPIEQQGPLFQLLGDVEGAIGVRLTESYLMIPNKSVSGLCFPSGIDWQNCLLCARPACPNRRAEYDPGRLVV